MRVLLTSAGLESEEIKKYMHGEAVGRLSLPLKDNLRLTNTCALAICGFPDELEIIGS